MAKPRKKRKKYSDAVDALSAFGGEQPPGGEPPAQQPPQAPQVPQAEPQPPAPEPIQAPPPPPPSPQLPADEPVQPPGPAQQAQASPAPPTRPPQPISPGQRPAIAPQIPDIPKVPQPAAQPPQVFPAGLDGAARRPAARRTARSRRPAVRRRQPKAIDPASYTRMQTAIPPLLTTGALVLILATVLAVKLPSGKVDDPTHMTMPPHPMFANPATKWIVLLLFPVGAGLLFGAFMLALQTGKVYPSQDQAIPRPRRHDRARPTRRR